MKKKIRTMPITALHKGRNMRKIFGLFTAFAIMFALTSCMQATNDAMDPVSADTVSVTSVSLNKTTLSLVVGGQDMIIATALPDEATVKTVTWSSSDESVATVNNGVITAIKVGTAIITVTTTDGSKTATCTVTVTAASAKISVTEVSVNKTTLSLVAGASETLVTTVSPDNATVKTVAWSSSDITVATVDANGKITAIKAGTATITATTTDGSKIAKCELTVTAIAVVLADTKVISETGYMIDFAGNATGKLVDKLTFSDKTSYKRFWLVKDGKHYVVDASGAIVENSTKVMTGMWLTESGKDVGWAVFVENTSATSNDGWYITKW